MLVDWLWPRGVKKERLRCDDWDKDAAPTPDLRKAFHSGELGFEEFYSTTAASSSAPARPRRCAIVRSRRTPRTSCSCTRRKTPSTTTPRF